MVGGAPASAPPSPIPASPRAGREGSKSPSSVVPGASGPRSTQLPAAQARPVPQLVLHPPQRSGSSFTFTSQPLAKSRSQSAKPASHRPAPQVPATHAGAITFGARIETHDAPQRPQCSTVAFSETSHPFMGSVSQSPRPAAHWAITQRPAVHPDDATVPPMGHTTPHSPQFSAEVLTSTQRLPHWASVAWQESTTSAATSIAAGPRSIGTSMSVSASVTSLASVGERSTAGPASVGVPESVGIPASPGIPALRSRTSSGGAHSPSETEQVAPVLRALHSTSFMQAQRHTPPWDRD